MKFFWTLTATGLLLLQIWVRMMSRMPRVLVAHPYGHMKNLFSELNHAFHLGRP